MLAAEVNTEPPNPRSLRFHRRFGFIEVARFRPYGPDAEEAMLVKHLGADRTDREPPEAEEAVS